MRKRILTCMIISCLLVTSFSPASFSYAQEKAAQPLPEKFQTYEEVKEKYPDTRSQNPYGACWAFAITACAEFDLVNQGVYTKEEADFSELQLIYGKYHTADDPLGLTHGDTVTYVHEEKSYMDAGGNIYSTIKSLMDGKSLTFEKNLPYERAEEALTSGLDSSWNAKNDAAQLRNAYSLDIQNDIDSVKRAIMEHGAVYAEYFDSWFNSYNEEYNTYCTTDKEGVINHAIAVVGWDDTIPKEHFHENNLPDRDGAWLIRNSWTTETGFNQNSYFYLSYADPTISNCRVLDFELNQYQHQYQHDGSISPGFYYVESAANVFQMQNVNNTNSQRLEAVMLSITGGDNVTKKMKIEIYTGMSDPKNPKSGYLNKAATTYFDATGYGVHTIPLKSPVILAPDEKYAIVISSVSSKAFNLGTEEGGLSIEGFKDGEEVPWFKNTVAVDPGESLYFREGKWRDVADTYSETSKWPTGNFSIKALVNDSTEKKYTISYHLNGGDNPNTNPSGYLEGTSVHFNAPSRNGYQFLGWYKDSKLTKKITDIPETSKANVTVYAKWKLHPTLKVKSCKTSGNPNLTWNEISGMKRFEIYRASSKSGTYKKIGTTTGTEYKDKKTTPGKTYYYKIKAVSKTGVTGYSEIKSISSKCETPLLSVKNVSSSGKPKLFWGTIEGAYKYQLYRSTSKNGTYKKILTTYDEGQYVDKTAKAGVKYYYKMKAYCKLSSKGNSAYSKVYQITCDCARPVVSAKLTSSGKPKLSWEKVSGAKVYEIYRASSKKGTYKKIYTTSKYTFTNTSAKKGKTYYYKVKAISGKSKYGHSVFSKYVYVQMR